MLTRPIISLALATAGAVSLGALRVHAAQPASLQVVAREFRYTLSRPVVPAGKVYVELDNFGEDAHDLMLQRKEGGPVIAFPETQSGQHTLKLVTLKAGHYRLWCGVANHEALGMTAILVVKAPASAKPKPTSKRR